MCPDFSYCGLSLTLCWKNSLFADICSSHTYKAFSVKKLSHCDLSTTKMLLAFLCCQLRGGGADPFAWNNLFIEMLRNRLLNESPELLAVFVVLWNIEFPSFLRITNKHSTNFVYLSFINKNSLLRKQ